jgi:hypothetical protein
MPRVPQLWTSPPSSEGHRHCRVSHSSIPCLPAQEGSGAAVCPAALDPATPYGEL